MRLVLTIGVSIGILQQITGINSVFFYAPMIFEQSGVGTDAAFMQAVLVGLVNLVFTVIAMAMIDRIGRRPLLGFGLLGIAVSMCALSYGFSSATYTLPQNILEMLPDASLVPQLAAQVGTVYHSDIAFNDAMTAALGDIAFAENKSLLINSAISINAPLILLAILAFVASFAVSIGPVMWVLFSEIFPTAVRGLAISFVGLINSAVSFTVQFIFPWELDRLGAATTFLIYGLFAALGLVLIMKILPETKGRSLEELELELVAREN
jgi:SP family arabinose:H+ symporter-like MFS transporter